MAPIASLTRQDLRAWWRSRSWPVPLVLVASCVLAARRGASIDTVAPSPEAALAEALSARGLSCDAADVAWVDGPRGVWGAIAGGARALVRARAGGDPSDLYLVETRLSPEGVVLDVGGAYDVTDTIGVDESRAIVRGRRAVCATTADGLFRGVHVLDLDGRSPGDGGDFTRLERAQAAITNLQETGSLRGVVRDTYALDPVARHVTAAWRDDATVEVHADAHTIVIDAAGRRAASGGDFVRVERDVRTRSRPGNLVTWAVDRARALPWFGADRMQWVKAIAFTMLDAYRARFAHATTAQDVQEELGLHVSQAASASFASTDADPALGWPPAPIKVPISPPLPGEGRWIALDGDPFITPTSSGAAPALVTSFVRPDAHRQDVRVYVTLWDPRQIALHMEAGTVEPIAADGEHGPGLVPRTPEVMKHLVAAFNGGFQAEHGEYGMQANGIEYLPPKPYAATVVELRDGSNGFGAWPGPQAGAADGAGGPAVPDDVVAFRQNLTAIVENGQFNPWHRIWWGGTPPGWPDQIHSARSAICLTSDGFVGYFYSASSSAEDLALGMLDARCAFGIHLDMNPGHAGFELYDVAPEGKLAALGRPLQSDWEADGKVPDMAGWVFRSRRMIRGMGHMLFPRYIHREARDFFYLTSRAILPGAPLAGSERNGEGEPGAGQWRTKGLPQHGFPYALATTWTRSPAQPGLKLPLKLLVVRADPRTMKPAGGHDDEPTVLTLAAPRRGELAIWWADHVFSIAASAPVPDATRLVAGYPASEAPAATAHAAAGVQDEDGMLVWVELPPGAHPSAETASAMDSLLETLGCSQRVLLPGEARALLGGTLDAAGDPVDAPAAPGERLVRAAAPDAHPIFADTPIVPVAVWQPLQAKRVRYFYEPPPPAASASAAAPAPAASAIRVQSNR